MQSDFRAQYALVLGGATLCCVEAELLGAKPGARGNLSREQRNIEAVSAIVAARWSTRNQGAHHAGAAAPAQNARVVGAALQLGSGEFMESVASCEREAVEADIGTSRDGIGKLKYLLASAQRTKAGGNSRRLADRMLPSCVQRRKRFPAVASGFEQLETQFGSTMTPLQVERAVLNAAHALGHVGASVSTERASSVLCYFGILAVADILYGRQLTSTEVDQVFAWHAGEAESARSGIASLFKADGSTALPAGAARIMFVAHDEAGGEFEEQIESRGGLVSFLVRVRRGDTGAGWAASAIDESASKSQAKAGAWINGYGSGSSALLPGSRAWHVDAECASGKRERLFGRGGLERLAAAVGRPFPPCAHELPAAVPGGANDSLSQLRASYARKLRELSSNQRDVVEGALRERTVAGDPMGSAAVSAGRSVGAGGAAHAGVLVQNREARTHAGARAVIRTFTAADGTSAVGDAVAQQRATRATHRAFTAADGSSAVGDADAQCRAARATHRAPTAAGGSSAVGDADAQQAAACAVTRATHRAPTAAGGSSAAGDARAQIRAKAANNNEACPNPHCHKTRSMAEFQANDPVTGKPLTVRARKGHKCSLRSDQLWDQHKCHCKNRGKYLFFKAKADEAGGVAKLKQLWGPKPEQKLVKSSRHTAEKWKLLPGGERDRFEQLACKLACNG
eukprot:g6784.t1